MAWTSSAWEAIYHQVGRFTADDVWAAMDEVPDEPRALGVIMRAAHRHGLIRPTRDFVPSKRASRHEAPIRVWEAV